MMDITTNRNSNTGAVLKWIALFIFLSLCIISMFLFHQSHSKKLISDSELIKQKSFLVTIMHKEMLLISRTQLELLHATNNEQVKSNLSQLTTLISNHLINYYQFKNIADESDAELLSQFKIGFKKWLDLNDKLLVYANSISDVDFINTLNKVDMAISQLDEEKVERLLLISQLEQPEKKIN